MFELYDDSNLERSTIFISYWVKVSNLVLNTKVDEGKGQVQI